VEDGRRVGGLLLALPAGVALAALSLLAATGQRDPWRLAPLDPALAVQVVERGDEPVGALTGPVRRKSPLPVPLPQDARVAPPRDDDSAGSP
jgi:hypothetical protein